MQPEWYAAEQAGLTFSHHHWQAAAAPDKPRTILTVSQAKCVRHERRKEAVPSTKQKLCHFRESGFGQTAWLLLGKQSIAL
jgi:hypothetical protein